MSEPEHPDIDTRSETFCAGYTREFLAQITQGWPVSDATPTEVADLLQDARRLYVGGAVTYSNYTAASRRGFQAAERGLQFRLGLENRPRRAPSWGALMKYEKAHPVLDEEMRDWYFRWGRHRNGIMHARIAFTEDQFSAEKNLSMFHKRVAMLFSQDDEGGDLSAQSAGSVPSGLD